MNENNINDDEMKPNMKSPKLIEIKSAQKKFWKKVEDLEKSVRIEEVSALTIDI